MLNGLAEEMARDFFLPTFCDFGAFAFVYLGSKKCIIRRFLLPGMATSKREDRFHWKPLGGIVRWIKEPNNSLPPPRNPRFFSSTKIHDSTTPWGRSGGLRAQEARMKLKQRKARRARWGGDKSSKIKKHDNQWCLVWEHFFMCFFLGVCSF